MHFAKEVKKKNCRTLKAISVNIITGALETAPQKLTRKSKEISGGQNC